MKLKYKIILDAVIAILTTAIGVVLSAMLITAIKTQGISKTSAQMYHINFCNDKEPGKIYVWENYKYHDKKLDEFQSNNNVEIISVTQNNDIFSYHVKCIANLGD